MPQTLLTVGLAQESFIWLAIANRKDNQIKFQDRSSNALKNYKKPN
jgi:hypothetical protein